MKQMSLVWTKHLKDDDPSKKQFEQALRASTTLIQRLLEILEEEERQADAAALSIKDFDDPSWAYKQAFRLGEKARIKKIRDLFEFAKPQ